MYNFIEEIWIFRTHLLSFAHKFFFIECRLVNKINIFVHSMFFWYSFIPCWLYKLKAPKVIKICFYLPDFIDVITEFYFLYITAEWFIAEKCVKRTLLWYTCNHLINIWSRLRFMQAYLSYFRLFIAISLK